MFKFVLCALFAAAVADPGLLYTPTYSETYVAPGSTTVTRHASSVINTPDYYSAYPFGYSHLIKKRSAQLLNPYVAPTTLVRSGWETPYTYLNSNAYLPYSPLQYSHLIKKRSPGLIPTSYIASPYTSFIAPSVATTYSSSLLHDTPLISSYVAPAHFIKKRSAAWVAPSYVAAAPIASTYVASAPLATTYSTAVLPSWPAYSAGLPFIKK